MITRAVSNRRSAVVGAALLVLASLVLAACSGSSPASTSSTTPAAAGGSAAPGGNAAGGGNGFAQRPGAFGTVAAIAGSTMQVQNQQTGQVAVSWTASTKFTHEVRTTPAAIKPGDCITASAPSGSSDSAFTASTVTVTQPVNGQCGGGAGRAPGGVRPNGFPTGARPSGAPTRAFPSGLPSGAAGRLRSGSFVTGTVTSVSGSSVVVAARALGTSSTSSRTVSIGAKTAISTRESTTAKSVKVGLCVNAQGKADSTGAVTASTVRISNPVNGACTVGFGGRNG